MDWKTVQIIMRQEAMMIPVLMVMATTSHNLGPPWSASRRAPADVYNASNMSTRCFVFPWRICFNVLYLSRPAAAIFLYSWSLWVSAECSLAASNSALSDYSHSNIIISISRNIIIKHVAHYIAVVTVIVIIIIISSSDHENNSL